MSDPYLGVNLNGAYANRWAGIKRDYSPEEVDKLRLRATSPIAESREIT